MQEIKEDYKTMFTEYPDVVNIEQMRKMLGCIGLTLAYKLLQEKVIHNIKIGREYKIPKVAIIEYLIKNE